MPLSNNRLPESKCRALVTGANGFVGHALIDRLQKEKSFDTVAAVRCLNTRLSGDVKTVLVPTLEAGGTWGEALDGIDIVIHTAARVHVMNETSSDPLTEFRKVNVEGTMNLARQAADAGIKRFIFISSIKVNGELTEAGTCFTADDIPAPNDAYGISKHEAETGLRSLAAKTGMEVTIIRPPLIYGPQVKANFFSMMRWLDKGVPLPLGAINNQRSLVSLTNLVDLVITCTRHANAANQTFLVSDGEDLSTTELLRRTSNALGTQARLLPIPTWMLRTSATLLGKGDIAQRLCSNLQIDTAKTQALLGWKPPVSVDEGLRLAAEAYLKSQRS